MPGRSSRPASKSDFTRQVAVLTSAWPEAAGRNRVLAWHRHSVRIRPPIHRRLGARRITLGERDEIPGSRAAERHANFARRMPHDPSSLHGGARRQTTLPPKGRDRRSRDRTGAGRSDTAVYERTVVTLRSVELEPTRNSLAFASSAQRRSNPSVPTPAPWMAKCRYGHSAIGTAYAARRQAAGRIPSPSSSPPPCSRGQSLQDGAGCTWP